MELFFKVKKVVTDLCRRTGYIFSSSKDNRKCFLCVCPKEIVVCSGTYDMCNVCLAGKNRLSTHEG